MKKLFPLIALLLVTYANRASADVACQKQLPRCTSATCNIPCPSPTTINECSQTCLGRNMDCGADFMSLFRPGTHKSPAYSNCMATITDHTTCTNDIFRSPSSWDYVAGQSDWEVASWPGSGPPVPHDDQGPWLDIYDAGLYAVIGSLTGNVTPYDYVDISVAWSTGGPQNIGLYKTRTEGSTAPPPPAIPDVFVASIGGMQDVPNGTLQYFRMTRDPEAGYAPWQWWAFGNQVARIWTIRTLNDLDSVHRALYIQSITETLGFHYNGTSCP